MDNVVIQGKLRRDRTVVKEIAVDDSGGIMVIPYEHARIHEGTYFGVGHYNSAVASTASIEVLITTPVAKTLHAYIKLLCGGDAEFRVFEGVTTSADGTVITATNHNRTSANTLDTTFHHTPTVTDYGTQIWEQFVPGGASGSSPGAVDEGQEQAVLKENTKYVMRITNIANGTQPENLLLGCYEVPSY